MTYNTRNPLGSNDPRDLFDNAQNFDKALNELVMYWIDRLGVQRLTEYGRNQLFNQLMAYFKEKGEEAITAVGWQELGDWSIGLQITNRNQIMSYNGSWYKFLGELPHTIAGDSPENDGGVWSSSNTAGVWANIGDAALRSELAKAAGAAMIGTSQGGTVQDGIRYYTPEMFGVVGDGTTDDYARFQNMLDSVPSGAIIHLDGSKTYYNAFATKALAGSWKISKPMTIHCNGALITRRFGTDITESQSAVLYVTSTRNVNLLGLNIDGNNPIDYPYGLDGVQLTAGNKTSLSQCINYGVYLSDCSGIKITCAITKCAFNIFANNGCSDLDISGTLNYGGQVVRNITSTDLAYGAGVKIADSTRVRIDVVGVGNANATVELEPSVSYAIVKQISHNNKSCGLAITDSQHIIFESTTYSGAIGTQITQTSSSDADRQVYGITGDCQSRSCSWGLLLSQRANAAQSMCGVTVRNQSYACTNYGLYLLNSSSLPISGVDIQHTGFGTGTTSAGNDTVVTGDIRGNLRTQHYNCYNGILIGGISASATALRVQGDFRDCSLSPGYAFGSSAYADLSGSITASEFMLTSTAASIRIARKVVSNSFGTYSDFVMRGTNFYMQGIATTATYSNQAWVDTANSNVVKVKL
ncbi:hypothetical protein [Gibbsiella quercinecans]|uniref:hypothetical protein n=1 Tax=Gibbsiella quercinecans TaxID=929813 RepID=UPI00243201CE|nr:hypothetical protein [Gibbsiella quercinecans]